MTSTVWYKATGDNGKALYGHGSWNLPTDTEPGDWMEPITWRLVECENGYHFHDSSVVHTLFGTEFYLAEPAGEQIVKNGLCLARGGRLLQKLNWNRAIAIQLADDVLAYMKRTYHEDIVSIGADAHHYYNHLKTATKIGWYYLLEEFMHYVFFPEYAFFPGRTWVSQDRLWMRQRLLMYLHGGIA
jgi:hypothetical protein